MLRTIPDAVFTANVVRERLMFLLGLKRDRAKLMIKCLDSQVSEEILE